MAVPYTPYTVPSAVPAINPYAQYSSPYSASPIFPPTSAYYGGVSPAVAATGPTIVPVSGAIAAPASTITPAAYSAGTAVALPGGYYGPNTVSMSYVTVPVKDTHVVHNNPTPVEITNFRMTFDSLAPKKRVQRMSSYKNPVRVDPIYFGVHKPILKDPQTGQPIWFRPNPIRPGVLGAFMPSTW
jgi:hypothetical protein